MSNEIHYKDITAVIHLGANSNTLEKDWKKIYKSNIESTRIWHEFAKSKNIPFIFSSSAAVYGNGNGPLNLYAFSKQASEQELDRAVILRLFNVYGPNEYHKGRMASTIFHWHKQILDTGKLKIFENSQEFRRDFVYVEDVADVIIWFLENYRPGIYDLGSGISESFDTLADLLITNLNKGSKEYIKIPTDLSVQYQKNTASDLSALEKAGYDTMKFRSLNAGVKAYLNYLNNSDYF